MSAARKRHTFGDDHMPFDKKSDDATLEKAMEYWEWEYQEYASEWDAYERGLGGKRYTQADAEDHRKNTVEALGNLTAALSYRMKLDWNQFDFMEEEKPISSKTSEDFFSEKKRKAEEYQRLLEEFKSHKILQECKKTYRDAYDGLMEKLKHRIKGLSQTIEAIDGVKGLVRDLNNIEEKESGAESKAPPIKKVLEENIAKALAFLNNFNSFDEGSYKNKIIFPLYRVETFKPKSKLDIKLREFYDECERTARTKHLIAVQRLKDFQAADAFLATKTAVAKIIHDVSDKLNIFLIPSALSKLDEANRLLQDFKGDAKNAEHQAALAEELEKFAAKIKEQKAEKEDRLNRHKNAIDQMVNKLVGDEKSPCQNYDIHLVKHLKKQLEAIPQETLKSYQDAKGEDVVIHIDKPMKAAINVTKLHGKGIKELDDELISKYISMTAMLRVLQNKGISPVLRLDEFFGLFDATLESIRKERDTGMLASMGKTLKSKVSSRPITKGGRFVQGVEAILGKDAKAGSDEAFIYSQLKDSAKMQQTQFEAKAKAQVVPKRDS